MSFWFDYETKVHYFSHCPKSSFFKWVIPQYFADCEEDICDPPCDFQHNGDDTGTVFVNTVAARHNARIIEISLCFRQTMYSVQLNKEACQQMRKQKLCHAVSYPTVVCKISRLCRVK